MPSWEPARPRLRLGGLLVAWVTAALAVYVATLLVPGVHVEGRSERSVAAALIALLNALLPPLIAALRLPFMLVAGFFSSCCPRCLDLQAGLGPLRPRLQGGLVLAALVAAIVVAAVTVVLEVLLGTNDDDTYTLRVIQRIARRSGDRAVTDVPGILYLEIDGLALPVLQRAMRDGHAPRHGALAGRGLAPPGGVGDRPLVPDRRLAVRASARAPTTTSRRSAGWRRRRGTLMTCSAPRDCASIEQRHSSGRGLLAGGGASRSNLLSGDADQVILTISRM